MKTFASGLAAHYQLANTSLVAFLEVRRRDGVYMRFSGADVDVTLGGDLYKSAPGLVLTDIAVSSGAAVDSLQLIILPDDDIPEIDLIAGRWDFATFRLFEANYLDPGAGINVLRRGWTGQADLTRSGYAIELRSLKQAWQQTIGEVTSKTCRARLGDERCTVDLTPFTHEGTVDTVGPFAPIPADTATGTLTGVSTNAFFGDSTRTEPDGYFSGGTFTFTSGPNSGEARQVLAYAGGEFTMVEPFDITPAIGNGYSVESLPQGFGGARQSFTSDLALVDDYFGEGSIEWLTGANAGFPEQKVRSYTGGIFSLSLAAPFAIGVGDTFRAVAGCRHRLIQDCVLKFDNALNFQGEPHVPGNDLLTADPDIG